MAYAGSTDLTTVGMPAIALGTLTTPQINAALDNASTYMDGYFRARWGATALPLSAWDSTVTECCAKIAAYRLIAIRGYNPESGRDSQFRTGYEDAVEWLNKVQRQQAHPLVTLASNATARQEPNLTSTSIVDLSNGSSAPNRGW